MTIALSAVEQTTSATDAALAAQCIVIAVCLWRGAGCHLWRARLWCWVLGLLALASTLGAIAHGFDMPDRVRDALWVPLYLILGVLVALFVVGAVHDWRGQAAAKRLVPWSIGAGAVLFALTEIFEGAFIVFVAYEAAAMVCALAIYGRLAATRRVAGAGTIAGAIGLSLVAAGAQASDISVRLVVPLDHNGVFHLVQMLSIGVLGLGLRLGMRSRQTGGLP